MQRAQLVRRECYLHRDGYPVGIVTDRVYARKGKGSDRRNVTYEHVPAGVRPVGATTDRTGAWVEIGYFGVRPITMDPERDYVSDMRKLPWDALIDPETELPRPDALPRGYEPLFVTGLRQLEGVYEEAVRRREVRNRRHATALERARNRHNDLATRLSAYLPEDDPVPLVQERRNRAPEYVPLSFAQAEQILKRLAQ